jgi:hypothetical protein
MEGVKNGMLASLKLAKYSWCEQLLEFQNKNGIKGVVCKSHDKNGNWPVAAMYFFPYPGTQYQLMIKTDQDEVLDSVLSTIRRDR